MEFDQLVKSILLESKDYFGKEIVFTDEETGKKMKGTIMDPNVVDEIDTEECHGPHITDEWFGANVDSLGTDFDDDNPKWYIVATGAWETCPTQEEFHIVSSKEVDTQIMLQNLKGDARETWEDILESKEQFDIKCIRGPYWLPDEAPDADEHFGYDCTLNGNKFIVGEEPADEFRYIYDMDKKDYNMYVKGKKDIMPLIRKAIELHKLKKGLKGSASYTWGDILS